MVALGVMALFSLQGLLLFLDEGIYHRQRGLGIWERWSHPLDSLGYVIALSPPAFFPPEPDMINLYIGLAIVSCLVITKDEWVHTRECKAGEHWLHSILFMVHPVVLIGVGYSWIQGDAGVFLKMAPFLVLLLALYQLACSGFRAGPKERAR
jgi:hypothetical protein